MNEDLSGLTVQELAGKLGSENLSETIKAAAVELGERARKEEDITPAAKALASAFQSAGYEECLRSLVYVPTNHTSWLQPAIDVFQRELIDPNPVRVLRAARALERIKGCCYLGHNIVLNTTQLQNTRGLAVTAIIESISPATPPLSEAAEELAYLVVGSDTYS